MKESDVPHPLFPVQVDPGALRTALIGEGLRLARETRGFEVFEDDREPGLTVLFPLPEVVTEYSQQVFDSAIEGAWAHLEKVSGGPRFDVGPRTDRERSLIVLLNETRTALNNAELWVPC
jgi:hypothetical protein